MKKIRLELNNELKKGIGNMFLTISSLMFMFVAVDSVVDISKSINDDARLLYIGITFVFFAVGCFALASIETSSTERYGIRMVQMTHPVHVKVDGRSPLPPIVEEPKETKTKSEKKKKDKRRRN